MNQDIASRLDELIFGYREGAEEEAFLRVQDCVEVGSHKEGQRWLSAAFALVRVAKQPGSPMPLVAPVSGAEEASPTEG